MPCAGVRIYAAPVKEKHISKSAAELREENGQKIVVVLWKRKNVEGGINTIAAQAA